MRKARRVLAGLLADCEKHEETPAPVPAWQAWLLTAWIVLVGIAFIVAMIRSM